MKAVTVLVFFVLIKLYNADHEDDNSDGRDMIGRGEDAEELKHSIKTAKKLRKAAKIGEMRKVKFVKETKFRENGNLAKKRNKHNKKSQQVDEKCLKAIIAKTKKFITYETQLRQVKRISALVGKLDRKKGKAKTVFKNAANIIRAATLNGTRCENCPIAKTDSPE